MRPWSLLAPGLLLAATLAPALPPALAGAAEDPIRPGGTVLLSEALCTMNFVFRDAAGTLYIGTAGHCAEGPGDWARTPGGPVFGAVVYDGEDDGRADFALIRIAPEHAARVDPAVMRWGGPVGVERAFLPGTPNLQYGHGTLFDRYEETRARAGVLLATDGSGGFITTVPVVGGDSGSPVLTHEGKAVGIIQGIETSLSFSFGFGDPAELVDLPAGLLARARSGPTVEQALADLRQAGLEVELVTAPFPPLPDQLLDAARGLLPA